MQTQRLSVMANQIGSYFAAYPDREQAKQEVVGHIVKFWTPAMRRSLVSELDQAPSELLPLVAEAVREHRAQLAPSG